MNNQIRMLGLFFVGMIFLCGIDSVSAQALAVPGNLNVTYTSSDGVSFQWLDNATDESYYEVERSDDAGTSWEEVAVKAPNTSSYGTFSLNCQTSYQYRVRAYRLSDNSYSAYSEVLSVTTGSCGINLYSSMTSTNSSIQLGFYSDMGNEWVYQIQRSPNGSSGWTQIGEVPASENYYTDTSVTCGTSYYYRIRGYRSSSNSYSTYSSNSLRSTTACLASAANNLSVTFGTNSATLNWTDNSTGESSFRVYRSDDGGSSWSPVGWYIAPNTTTYTDNNLGCLNYIYRVQALSNYGYSSAVSGSTGSACSALVAPTITNSYIRNGRFSLWWSESNRDESNIHIERSTDGGVSWEEVAIEDTYSSFSDASILCGTDYQYRIRAYRSLDDNYSSYSTISTVNLPCTTPLAEEVCSYTPLFAILGSSMDYPKLVRMSGDGSRAFVMRGNLDMRTLYDNLYHEDLEVWDINTQTQLATISGIEEFVVSDNGLRVAYFSDEELYLWDNGTVSQLSNNNTGADYKSLSMNGAGTKITFVAASSSTGLGALQVWTEGVGFENPVSDASLVSLAALSGDGTSIIFLSFDNLTGESTEGFASFYRWDAATETVFLGSSIEENSEQVVDFLTVDDAGSNFAFRYDDGTYTASDVHYELIAWNETHGFNPLFGYYWENPLIIRDDYASIYPAGWSGNGERLMFVAPHNLTGENPDGYVDENEFYAEYFFYDNGNIRQITSSIQLSDHPYVMAISDDGSRILTYTMLPSQTDAAAYDAAIPYLAIGDCGPVLLSWIYLVNSYATTEGVYLNWEDYSDSESGFHLERSNDAGASWELVADLAPDTVEYFDTTISCDTYYHYRIQSYRNSDSTVSPYTTTEVLTPEICGIPESPYLGVAFATEYSIDLSWFDAAFTETAFSLERSTDGITWTEIAQPAANSTVYTDTGLSCNTTYDYRIRAYRSGDNQYSAYSNIVEKSTNACSILAFPTGLVVTGTAHTNIALAWTDNAGDETGYRVERSADNGTSWTEIATPAANGTSYNDTSAACNTSYDYRVRAYRAGDNQYSAYSNVVSASTDVCITLNAPTNIQQTANSQTGMSLSWTDNSSNESGYEIERSLDGTSWTLLSSLPADSTIYSDSGLNCATSYYYRLRSNHLGTGAYSNYGTSGALATAACPALVASVLSSTGSTANSISLSWTVDSSATSFTLAYYNGSSWVNLGIFPASTTTYTQSGLICGRNIQYQVTSFRSVDSASVTSDAFSTSTSACPPLAAPTAPVVLNTEPALVSLQIPVKPATATSMNLERSLDGTSWTSLGNVTGSSYIDTAVLCGSSYQYRLVALRSSDGITSTSPVAVALTDACPIPTVLGTYRAGLWTFVASNNTAMPVNSFNFGDSSWQALVGDWDGDGVDGVGLYRNGEFALKNTASADAPENRFNFGNAEAGWQALVGDWDGNGTDTVGLYKDGLFLISNDNVNIQYRFNFGNGQAGWQAIAGDWNGDGQDGIGLYQNGYWALADNVSNPDGSRQNINYGPSQAGWLAIVGDWNGDGYDSIGLYKEGIWRMRTNSVNDASESSLNFGQTADVPLAIFEN